MKITVKTILRAFLWGQGYDGLCNENCGCSERDLAPCGEVKLYCKPAYRTFCKNCKAELFTESGNPKERCDAC